MRNITSNRVRRFIRKNLFLRSMLRKPPCRRGDSLYRDLKMIYERTL